MYVHETIVRQKGCFSYYKSLFLYCQHSDHLAKSWHGNSGIEILLRRCHTH